MLRSRNRIYETVFTARWANENLPLHWRGPAYALALIVALTAIPFAYTQLLPRPYMRIMTAPSTELAAVQEAYINLRSYPGHRAAADRVFSSVLVRRAETARDSETISEIDRFARTMPDAEGFARARSRAGGVGRTRCPRRVGDRIRSR